MRADVKLGPDGVWYARPYLGTDALGRKIRPYRSFPGAESEAEAQALADAWARHLTADGRVRSMRLADLLEDYIDARRASGASPNSTRTYRTFTVYVRRYLKRALASDLTVMDFERFQLRLLTPKDEGGQGLSRSSVSAVHNFLRGAYNWAVRAGLCETNPMVSVSKPAPEHVEAASLDEADFAELESALTGAMDGSDMRQSVMAYAAWLALRTGMRVGEVCAVRRRDVNGFARFVHVGGNVIEERGRKPYRREVTKGRKCRNVSITESDVRRIDGMIRLQDERRAGLGADTPLVTTDGSYMRPSAVSDAFSSLRDRLGLPRRVTFHGLRHTHATWCLANGVDLKTLSERLGHADAATTLRVYAHVLPGRDAAAAEAFARAAGAARDRFGS